MKVFGPLLIIICIITLLYYYKTREKFDLIDVSGIKKIANDIKDILDKAKKPFEDLKNAFNVKGTTRSGCPPGWRDDGTVCWLDLKPNGVGTIPTLNPCPPGSDDVWGTCWYPGSGGACRTVDKGFYNESWGAMWCNGPQRRETRGLFGVRTGWDDCYRTWLPRLETTCDPVVPARVAKNIGDRGSSCGDKVNVAGLCYNKCENGWELAGTPNFCQPKGGIKRIELADRLECKDPEYPVRRGLLCYRS